jgi:hypothetical protein
MNQAKHSWFGMKLTPAERQKIERLAKREGLTAKQAILRAVDKALEGDSLPSPQPGSFLENIEDLVGSVDSDEGPIDLASNPKHLQGLGR